LGLKVKYLDINIPIIFTDYKKAKPLLSGLEPILKTVVTTMNPMYVVVHAYKEGEMLKANVIAVYHPNLIKDEDGKPVIEFIRQYINSEGEVDTECSYYLCPICLSGMELSFDDDYMYLKCKECGYKARFKLETVV